MLTDMSYLTWCLWAYQVGAKKMDKKKKAKLEAKGYKVGTVNGFLGLSKEEVDYIELKLALSQAPAGRGSNE